MRWFFKKTPSMSPRNTLQPSSWHLSQQVLLQVVSSQQHLSLVLATLQLIVLALPTQQAGLLFRLHLLQTLLLADQPLLFLPLRGGLVLVELLEVKVERR